MKQLVETLVPKVLYYKQAITLCCVLGALLVSALLPHHGVNLILVLQLQLHRHRIASDRV